MKIHDKNKIKLIRLTIKGNCQDTKYLTLEETSHSEVIEFTIKNFSNFMVKRPAFKTSIDIRRCEGGNNYESQRICVYGLKPEEVKNILVNKINNK